MKIFGAIFLYVVATYASAGVIGSNLPTLTTSSSGGNSSPTYPSVDWKHAWTGNLHDRTLTLNIPSGSALRVKARTCYLYNPNSQTTDPTQKEIKFLVRVTLG